MINLDAEGKNFIAESFGVSVFRGKFEGQKVLLAQYSLDPRNPGRANELENAFRRWETVDIKTHSLAKLLTWDREEGSLQALFEDTGGLPMSMLGNSDLFEVFRSRLPVFLQDWNVLETLGVTWCHFDPRLIFVLEDRLVLCAPWLLIEPGSAPPHGALVREDWLSMAPEMTRRTTLPVDRRSGFYSLGTILYKIALGRWPFEHAEPMSLISAILNQNPIETGLDQHGLVYESITRKLLSKSPRDRYQTLRGLLWDWSHLNENSTLVLGSHDQPLPLRTVNNLFGREQELKALTESLQSSESGFIAMLLGEGGIGKTALAEEFLKLPIYRRFHRISGKCDERQLSFSGGALANALLDWFATFPMTHPQQYQAFQENLIQVLGRNLNLLLPLFPALNAIQNKIIPWITVPPDEQHRRFKASLITLMESIANFGPVSILLEDLQWADDFTWEILSEFVQSPRKPLLFLLTGRPQLSSSGFELKHQMETASHAKVIQLEPLNQSSLEHFVHEISPPEFEQQSALTHLLWNLTEGNPLTLGLQIQEINRKELIFWDTQQERWVLDERRISNLPFQGAEELVSRRIAELQLEAQRVISASSVLEPKFSAMEAFEVAGIDDSLREKITGVLAEAGLWERQGLEVRFPHDRIRDVVYSRLSEKEVQQYHFKIGQLRWEQRLAGAKNTFTSITTHWNRATALLNKEQKNLLTELNLEAGKEAHAQNDLESALLFWETAITEAGIELWTQAPDKAFELYLNASEAASILHRVEISDQWANLIFEKATQPLQKAQIRERQQYLRFYLGDMTGSIQAGLQGLKVLGVNLPESPGMLKVVGELLRLKFQLRRRSTAQISQLPLNQKPESRLTMLLLSGFIPPAFNSNRQNLFGLAVLKAAQLSLKDGLCPESAPSFTGYSMLLSALGSTQQAYEWAQFALELNKRFDDVTWRPMVMTLTGLFSKGWHEPWERLKPYYELAQIASEEAGDVLYRNYTYLFAALWNSGEDIPRKQRELEEVLEKTKRLQFPLTKTSTCVNLAALKLLSTKGPVTLDFRYKDEDPMAEMAEYRRTGKTSAMAVIYSTMMKVAYLLKDWQPAASYLKEALSYRSSIVGSLYEEEFLLYAGLIAGWGIQRGEREFAPILSQAKTKARRWAKDASQFLFHQNVL